MFSDTLSVVLHNHLYNYVTHSSRTAAGGWRHCELEPWYVALARLKAAIEFFVKRIAALQPIAYWPRLSLLSMI